MPTLIPAEGPLLDRILLDQHTVWGAAFTPGAWVRLDRAVSRTAWSRAHRQTVALVEGGDLLASAVRCELSARIDGRIRRVLGLGRVCTPPGRRGRGHASALMTALLEAGETDGCEFALLLSDIGPQFFERFDFVPLPLHEMRLGVRPHTGGAPAVLMRGGDDKDLPAVAEMHTRWASGMRMALDRSEEFVRHAVTRRRLEAGLAPPGDRHLEFLVTEEGHQAVSYLVASVRGRDWVVEECGDRDPSGARLGAMLQVMLAREPAQAPPDIRVWWPEGYVPPQVEVLDSAPTAQVLMLRPLTNRVLPLPPVGSRELLFWHADAI